MLAVELCLNKILFAIYKELDILFILLIIFYNKLIIKLKQEVI